MLAQSAVMCVQQAVRVMECCGHLPCQQIHQRVVSLGRETSPLAQLEKDAGAFDEAVQRFESCVRHEGIIIPATVSERVSRTVDVSGLTLQ
jgi:hypothetical protein